MQNQDVFSSCAVKTCHVADFPCRTRALQPSSLTSSRLWNGLRGAAVPRAAVKCVEPPFTTWGAWHSTLPWGWRLTTCLTCSPDPFLACCHHVWHLTVPSHPLLPGNGPHSVLQFLAVKNSPGIHVVHSPGRKLRKWVGIKMEQREWVANEPVWPLSLHFLYMLNTTWRECGMWQAPQNIFAHW